MANEIVVIDGGSKQYWADLRQAYALIRIVEHCIKEVQSARPYIGRCINEDGEMEIEENTGPYEELAEAQEAVKAHPTAMRIVEAQGRNIFLLCY